MAEYTTVARPYAKAVFGVARESGDLEGWLKALNAAAAVVAEEEARALLSRPELRAADKARFIESVCEGLSDTGALASEKGRNLLALLAEYDRLEALPEIAAQFEQLKNQAEDKIRVTLVSASEVDEEQAAKFASALERKLGRKIELGVEVDASLLGGAIVRAEDMVIDGSVRSRLARLADRLID